MNQGINEHSGLLIITSLLFYTFFFSYKMNKKNVSLSIQNRLDIYDMKKKKSSMTNAQLAMWAKEEFQLTKAPDSSTISKILKRGAEGSIKQSDIKNRKRVRKVKWPVIIFSKTYCRRNQYSVNSLYM
jgi:hypothetical protein